jgi:anti-sigma factor RsiW
VTCRELADFIDDYLTGALAAEVRATFDHHLTLCPACVNFLAAYQATVELNRRAFASTQGDNDGAADAPEDLVKAILASRRS